MSSKLLVKLICRLMAKFPSDEKFGLVSQMRQAAVSIPSNLAELIQELRRMLNALRRSVTN